MNCSTSLIQFQKKNQAPNQIASRDIREDLMCDIEECVEGVELGCELVSPIVNLEVWDKQIKVLIDSGCERSCISSKFYNECMSEGRKLEDIPVKSTHVITAVGTKSQKIQKQVIIPVKAEVETFLQPCLIVNNLVFPMILGVDWLSQHQVKIDFEAKCIYVVGDEAKGKIKIRFDGIAEEGECVEEMQGDSEDKRSGGFKIGHMVIEDDRISEIQDVIEKTEIKENQKEQLEEILREYVEIFSESPGKTHTYEHSFSVRDNSNFVGPVYAIPQKYAKAVDEEIKKMLSLGIIEPSASANLNPLVVIPKKDGSVRLCIDARQLNKRIEPDQQRAESIEGLIQRFEGCKIFSIMDLSASFWQIPLKAEDRPLTAFAYKNFLYQFTRVPFGTRTSSAALIRAMSRILGSDTAEFATSYVDDLVIASRTFEDHIRHLQLIFEKIQQGGLTLKITKSIFCASEITFLGHTVSEEGVRPERSRLEKICNTPTPENLKQLKSFLGVCNYFRRFVLRYSFLTEPFRELLKGNTRWKWTNVHDVAYQRLKAGFCEAVTLQYPSLQRGYILMTDASMEGVAGILCQKDEDGNLGIVSLASRGLSIAEKRYTVTELELLAIIYSVTKFRTYVLGVNLEIWTDHNALVFIDTCKLTSNRMTRWILALSEYDYSIKHIKGKENVIADFLSRSTLNANAGMVPQQGILICTGNATGDKETQVRLKQLKFEQEKDKGMSKILEILKGMKPDESVKQGKYVYKLVSGFLARKAREEEWKILVPVSLQNDMIWYVHYNLGHFGANKVLHELQRNFIWKNMGRQVRKTLATCDLCQRSKHPNRYLEGPRQAVIRQKPRELLSVDLFGPLVKSSYGYQYIFVVLDSFTKFVKMYPMRVATARGCVKILTEKYIPEFGCPEAILSDHGSQFTAKIWTKTLRDMNIEVLYSSIRNPQSNMVERVMKDLGRMMRTYVHLKHNSWFSKLQTIENWCNMSYHESIGCTPFEVQYGKKHCGVMEKLLGLEVDEKNYSLHFLNKAQKNIIAAAKKRIDRRKHRVGDEFNVGDKVLLRVPLPSSSADHVMSKFFLLYKGCYTVAKRIGKCAYSLVDNDGMGIGTFNIRAMKRYIE